MTTETAIGLAIAAVLLITILRAAVKILPEYQRGVLFRLGRVTGEPKGPGLILIIPIVDRLLRVSLRTVTQDIPPQDIITRDNVTVKVNAVTYFRVVDPNLAILEIEDYKFGTNTARERRDKEIHALGEKEAAETLADAARLLENHPAAMQLRILQTMTEVAAEQNSTLIFPLPMEILRVLAA